MTNFLQEFLDLSHIDLKQAVYESMYVFLASIESIIFKRQTFILNFIIPRYFCELKIENLYQISFRYYSN